MSHHHGIHVLGAAIGPMRGPQRVSRIYDQIDSPRVVIANSAQVGKSVRMDGGITRVVVSGGKRRLGYLDPDTVMYEAPASVTVYPVGANPRTMTGLQALMVIAGNRSLDIIAGDVAVGAITDTATDYDAGERLVIQMNQVLNALGRPKEFEAPAQAIWAVYEKEKAGVWWTQTDKFMNATAMKQIGQDAARLTAEMQRAYPGQLAAVPSANVPTGNVNDSWWNKFFMPSWGWGVGALAAGGLALYFGAPLVIGSVASRAVRR